MEISSVGAEFPDEPKSESKSKAAAKRLLRELSCALERERTWRRESKRAWDAYLGRKKLNSSGVESDDPDFNLFWSNIETQRPAYYSGAPRAVVERRYKDKNPVARVASQLLERSTAYFIQPEYFDPKAERLILDFLVPGRAVPWIRYVSVGSATTQQVRLKQQEGVYLSEAGESVNPSEIEILSDEQGEYYNDSIPQIDYEEVVCEPLHYRDFLTGQCSDWANCPWVARRTRLSKRAAKKRFGEVAEKLKYSSDIASDDELDRDEESKQSVSRTEIWELWEKETRRVYWLSIGYDDLLDAEEDPLGLESFFPCPEPLLATVGPDSITPRPDYCLYSDHLDYIDELTNRVDYLTRALALKGVRDAKYEDLDRLISESAEADLVPMENFMQFSQEGGLDKTIQFMPIEMIAKVLKYLIELRESAKQVVYEITGLSDIVRGSSDPRETATAQRTKAQFGSYRLEARKRKVARFFREIVAIKAEIIAEKFQPETIALIADVETFSPEDQALIPQAMALLKADALRAFKIDIETTDTMAADEQAEKQAALEMIQTVGKVMEQTVKFASAAPDFADAMGVMFLFVVRKFRPGRSIEGKLESATESFISNLKAQLEQQKGKPPPEEIQAQVDAQKAQLDAQTKQMDLQGKSQQIQSEIEQKARELELKQQELQNKFSADQSELEQKFSIEQQKLRLQEQELAAEIALKTREIELKEAELGLKRLQQSNDQAVAAQQALMTTDEAGKIVPIKPKRKRLNVERDPVTGLMVGAEIADVDDGEQGLEAII